LLPFSCIDLRAIVDHVSRHLRDNGEFKSFGQTSLPSSLLV